MDFLKDYQIIYSSKQHQQIYDYFSQNKIMTIEELFLLSIVIGFYYPDEKREVLEGPTINGEELSKENRARIYTMILADHELGKNIFLFQESDFQEKAIKKIEKYANIGIRILIRDVFTDTWNNHRLDESYSGYKLDILSYIHQVDANPPF